MGDATAFPVHLRVLRLQAGARLPVRATPAASGYDLFACIEGGSSIELGPDPALVPTGIAVEFPQGFDLQVRPRSGLARRGVMVAYGTVDADYRGELFVTMYTLGSLRSFVIHDGDRIAQLVLSRLADLEVTEVTGLGETERGAGGHGSTGMR